MMIQNPITSIIFNMVRVQNAGKRVALLKITEYPRNPGIVLKENTKMAIQTSWDISHASSSS